MRRVGLDHFVACHHPLIEPWPDDAVAEAAVRIEPTPDTDDQGSRQLGPKPANNLVWAILTTLFCCLPFGIVSIVFAAQVDGKYNSGDYAGAVASSKSARTWAIAAAASFFVIIVLLFLFGALGSTSTNTG